MDDDDICHWVNPIYLDSQVIQCIKDNYENGKPFHYAVLPNFLDNTFLGQVKAEIETEEWHPRNNDLYTFLQTDDIQNMEKPNIKRLRQVIYSGKFRNFIHQITGIELNDTVHASASRYWQSGHLLCHDDQLDDRQIAFIFYLVPPDWDQADGGFLEFFGVDEYNEPQEVVNSILPQWNHLIFFQVTPKSFHQVAEVLSSNKQRLAISGWWHGSKRSFLPPREEPKLPRTHLVDYPSINLAEWIRPRYLNSRTQQKIAKQFEENSSIELQDLLTDAKFEALIKEMVREENNSILFSAEEEIKYGQSVKRGKLLTHLDWKVIGPANRRHYETLGRWTESNEQIKKVPPIVADAMRLFQSVQFGEFLSKITGLDLLNVHLEVRRFQHGAYALTEDNIEQHKECGLDAYYFLCPNDDENGGWDVDVGGQITYIDEESELITIIPSNNTFSITFRDEGCMKFVKYINNEAPVERQEFAMIYWEDQTVDEAGNNSIVRP